MKIILTQLVLILLSSNLSIANPNNICGGPINDESYIKIAQIGVELILHPNRQEHRDVVGLDHLLANDFNIMQIGDDCTNLLNHLGTFELNDSDEIHPLQKPVFYKAGEFYFVFYIIPVATVNQESDGSIQIKGRFSGRTTVIVLDSDFDGVTLFIL